MKKTREEMVRWVQRVAKAQEIHCEIEHEEKRDIIRMGFRLNNAIPAVDVAIAAEEDGFHSYGFIGNNAGKRLSEVGEFLMRANINDVGHFNLDYDEGQICYEFSSPYLEYEEDDDLTLLWRIPLIRFNDFGDALLKVILGCATPKEAFEESIKTITTQENGEEKK